MTAPVTLGSKPQNKQEGFHEIGGTRDYEIARPTLSEWRYLPCLAGPRAREHDNRPEQQFHAHPPLPLASLVVGTKATSPVRSSTNSGAAPSSGKFREPCTGFVSQEKRPPISAAPMTACTTRLRSASKVAPVPGNPFVVRSAAQLIISSFPASIIPPWRSPGYRNATAHGPHRSGACPSHAL
jgi:hypothetical protein